MPTDPSPERDQADETERQAAPSRDRQITQWRNR